MTASGRRWIFLELVVRVLRLSSTRQVLEDMVERGEMPRRRHLHAPVSVVS